MLSSPSDVPLCAIDLIAPAELANLFETAVALRHAARAGVVEPLLKGRRFGAMRVTASARDEDGALVDQAAAELGGQVAHIRPLSIELDDSTDAQRTAKMLGRLYSAVVCQGLARQIVLLLRANCQIPVYSEIMAPNHPVTRVAGMLGASMDDRRFAVQALLLKSIG